MQAEFVADGISLVLYLLILSHWFQLRMAALEKLKTIHFLMEFFCHLHFPHIQSCHDSDKDATSNVVHTSSFIESRGVRTIHGNCSSTRG